MLNLKTVTVACLWLFASSLSGDDQKRAISPELLTDAYVPLVIVGEGWSQQIAIQNLDSEEDIAGTLKFFTAQGEAWPVELVGHGKSDTFFVTLRPHQFVIYETVAKFEPQSLGYAHIDADCCPRSHIQTIFRRQETGRPDLMTSLPIGDYGLNAVHVLFDNRGGKYAGVGILNTASCYSFSCETEMELIFRDERGNVILRDRKTRRNRTLWWFSLSAEYPQVVGITGSLEVKSGATGSGSQYISAVGFSLQFAPNGAFTAVTTAEP